MWIGVRQRFTRLHNELLLTDDQLKDGMTKQFGIRQKLEQSYYEQATEQPPGFMVGSWGKGTQVKPPRDLDLFFVLPADVFSRIDSRTGNKQSALLQEVKGKLQDKYSQSDLRGDGQVVLISFNTIDVEVVPVFAIANNQYVMPDANDGGQWKIVDPLAQITFINSVDEETYGNARSLARMMKLWKRENDVPIKSFVVELIVSHFLADYVNANKDYFWYDWIVRDFLLFLSKLSGGTLTLPGTGDVISLGSEWKPKTDKAIESALRACDYEYNDWTILAGEEWQKIFGTRIPTLVT